MKNTGWKLSIVLIILITDIGATAQPKYRPAGLQRKRPQTGTVNVTTKISGTLLLDDKPAKKMTIYHQVTISGIDTGYHMLSFKSGDKEIHQKVLVSQGVSKSFIIRTDSAVMDSTSPGVAPITPKLKIHSAYIPFKKGFCGLIKIGFSTSSSNGKSPFYGQAIAGYQFSPVLSLGGGIGYVKNYSTFYHHQINHFIIDQETETIRSDAFSVAYIPVFINLRLTISKKRVNPCLSADIGLSIPLNQKFDGFYTKKISKPNGGYTNQYPFHVVSISPGLYFGINPGLKCFLYGRYYMDILFGWDICVNQFKGTLPTGSSKMKGTSGFHMNIGFGF